MLSESVLSVRKELFPQNKTAVSDMPKVNIQKKVQPTDADMVQTSLSFENIYYSLWEISKQLGNSWTLQQLLPVSRDWKQS